MKYNFLSICWLEDPLSYTRGSSSCAECIIFCTDSNLFLPQVIIGGSSGSGGFIEGGVAAAAAAGGAALAAEAPPAEEKKEEKKESDNDMGFSLFD